MAALRQKPFAERCRFERGLKPGKPVPVMWTMWTRPFSPEQWVRQTVGSLSQFDPGTIRSPRPKLRETAAGRARSGNLPKTDQSRRRDPSAGFAFQQGTPNTSCRAHVGRFAVIAGSAVAFRANRVRGNGGEGEILRTINRTPRFGQDESRADVAESGTNIRRLGEYGCRETEFAGTGGRQSWHGR